MSHWEYWIIGGVGGVSMAALILMLCLEKVTRHREVPREPISLPVQRQENAHANPLPPPKPPDRCDDCANPAAVECPYCGGMNDLENQIAGHGDSPWTATCVRCKLRFIVRLGVYTFKPDDVLES